MTLLVVKGAGICSLYHEIHYIEIRYIKVWVYKISDDESGTRNQILGCVSNNNSQKKMGLERQVEQGFSLIFLPIFWQNVTIFHRT